MQVIKFDALPTFLPSREFMTFPQSWQVRFVTGLPFFIFIITQRKPGTDLNKRKIRVKQAKKKNLTLKPRPYSALHCYYFEHVPFPLSSAEASYSRAG